MRRLEARVSLVTGGPAGLGLAIALRLNSEGPRVIITDLQRALGQNVAAEDATFLKHSSPVSRH